MKLTVLDLFCGLGGLSLGFEMTGAFQVVGGIDNYKWAVRTFYENHSIGNGLLSRTQDISTLSPQTVLDELGAKPDVVVGGPPCQGFSHAGKRYDCFKHDPRNEQVYNFFKFVKEIAPKVFLMENVSGMLSVGQKRKYELLNSLKQEYEELGYNVSWQILNSVDYRVPQQRKRLFLAGILESEHALCFPEPVCTNNLDLFYQPEPFYTVEDALSDLPTPIEQEPQPYEEESKKPLQRFLRDESESIHNHSITKHKAETIEKIKKQEVGTRLYPNWNHSWYRLDASKPSPTVKENHRAPFVHFSENRVTSPRECARLQTIPDRYVIAGTKTAQLTLIGNAVPPILSAHLATGIAEQCFHRTVPYEWKKEKSPLLAY